MSADGKLLLSFIKVIILPAISLKESLYNVKYAVSAIIMAEYIGWKKLVSGPSRPPSPVSVSEIAAPYPLWWFLGPQQQTVHVSIMLLSVEIIVSPELAIWIYIQLRACLQWLHHSICS